MRRSTLLILGAAGAGGVVAARAAVRRRTPASRSRHSLTVLRQFDQLPPELADLGDAVDITLRPAPGDRGTEIHVHRTGDSVSDDDIRSALRIARSRLETGDVLRPAVATTTPTLLNKGLRAVTARGRKKGLL